ncbi:DUF3644 domain-containing protein [Pseudosporangium ferrugineum]|uniref:Uncharacterized protein DUF3644 n=1 Tax=Pseudosporangium ferrugineum TaxID=439699 RepID=A0A2T0RCL1_9ACTN|nr:DUF3644 domain-containing protein [Pseudosporangium ferrugineum]PRY18881.1 uncharacterized protein DUF3644 [Pseudosporangium ferrugineum]
MAPRPRWHHTLTAAQAEALTAIEIYNSPTSLRPLEGFLVHMHVAWLYLLHASFDKQKISYHYKDPKTGRYVRVDGEKKSWELQKCVEVRWPSVKEPVRQNLELTVQLRNKIEHRFERGLMVAASGFAQSLIMNYEAELVSTFGNAYSIADRVHIPVALSTFSREGAAAMASSQLLLPKRLRDFFIDYRARLDDGVLNDQAFEMRIEIVQKRSPKTEADLAVSFVREDDLTSDELDAYKQLERVGRVILRDKDRDVANVGWLKPSAASAAIQAGLTFRFSPSAEFPRAWRHYKVRPDKTAVGRQRNKTTEMYCRYDEPHDDYLYSQAYVDFIVSELSDPVKFQEVIGWPPKSL